MEDEKTKGQAGHGGTVNEVHAIHAAGAPGDGNRDGLSENEAWCRSNVEHNPAIVYTAQLDPLGTILYISPRVKTFLGYTPEEFQAEPGMWVRLLHPEDRERVLSEVGRSHKTGEPFVSEYRLIAKDRRVVWVRDEAAIVSEAGNKNALFQGVVLDLTGQKQAEELLRIERDLALSLVAATNLQEALGLLLKTTASIYGIDGGGVYLVNSKTGGLDLVAHRGLSARFFEAISQCSPDTPEARVAMTGVPAYRSEPKEILERGRIVEREAIRALALIPVKFGDRVIAVLGLVSRTHPYIPECTRHALETIVAQVGVIIARLETEGAHRALLERYRMLFNKANDAVFVLGLASELMPGTHLEVNDVACEKLGYTRPELLALPPAAIVAPECLSALPVAMQKLLEEKHALFEITLVAKNGGRIPFEVSAHLFDLGGEPTILSIKRDISERKEAEQALRESEARYRAIVEDQTELICRFTPDGTLTFVNDAYCRYFGGTSEEFLGKSFLPLIPPQDRKRAEKHFRSLARQEPIETIIHQVVAPCGEMRWQQWTDRAIYNEQGEIVEYQSVGRDVTELKKIEEALREARDNLEEDVAERTAGLARANKQLSMEIEDRKRTEESLRKSEERLRFLSLKLLTIQEEERRRVSQELHDSIGQAMVGVKYGLEHLQRALVNGRTEGMLQDFAQLIKMLQSCIDETRRICSGLRPSILDDFGILAGIEWLCEQLRTTSAAIGVEQKIQVKEKDIPDRVKTVVFRVLQEALSNVLKHSQADLVRISFKKAKGSLRFAVEDNGMGFDLASALSEHPSQRGLGLMTMRERTELSDGSFSIRSRAGKGTRVSAVWPCTEAEAGGERLRS